MSCLQDDYSSSPLPWLKHHQLTNQQRRQDPPSIGKSIVNQEQEIICQLDAELKELDSNTQQDDIPDIIPPTTTSEQQEVSLLSWKNHIDQQHMILLHDVSNSKRQQVTKMVNELAANMSALGENDMELILQYAYQCIHQQHRCSVPG